jgi:hypothetical protein
MIVGCGEAVEAAGEVRPIFGEEELGVFDRIFAALAADGPKPERIMIEKRTERRQACLKQACLKRGCSPRAN